MWLFLSSRIRTWLLFSIAVPVLAKAVHSATERARASNPSSRTTSALSAADATLRRLSRRRTRRRHQNG